jgi:hypothetical protein
MKKLGAAFRLLHSPILFKENVRHESCRAVTTFLHAAARLQASVLVGHSYALAATDVSKRHTRFCDLLFPDEYEALRLPLVNAHVSRPVLLKKVERMLHWLRGAPSGILAKLQISRLEAMPARLEEDCAVCMEVAGPGEAVAFDHCGHWLCTTCIEAHFNATAKHGKIKCPLCRCLHAVPADCTRVTLQDWTQQTRQVSTKIDALRSLIASASASADISDNARIVVVFQHPETKKTLLHEFPQARKKGSKTNNSKRKRKRSTEPKDNSAGGGNSATPVAASLPLILLPYRDIACHPDTIALSDHCILFEPASRTLASTPSEWGDLICCSALTTLVVRGTTEEYLAHYGWSALSPHFNAQVCDLQQNGLYAPLIDLS